MNKRSIIKVDDEKKEEKEALSRRSPIHWRLLYHHSFSIIINRNLVQGNEKDPSFQFHNTYTHFTAFLLPSLFFLSIFFTEWPILQPVKVNIKPSSGWSIISTLKTETDSDTECWPIKFSFILSQTMMYIHSSKTSLSGMAYYKRSNRNILYKFVRHKLIFSHCTSSSRNHL